MWLRFSFGDVTQDCRAGQNVDTWPANTVLGGAVLSAAHRSASAAIVDISSWQRSLISDVEATKSGMVFAQQSAMNRNVSLPNSMTGWVSCSAELSSGMSQAELTVLSPLLLELSSESADEENPNIIEMPSTE